MAGDDMSAPKQSEVQNKLLRLLPSSDFDLITQDLEYVHLPRGMPLAVMGEAIEHVYFMESGIGSVVTTTPEGNHAEAGIFGFDGYVPTTALGGVHVSPHDVNIQAAGDGHRIPYGAFQQWMKRSESLAAVVTRSMEAFAVQLAYTAASNALHEVNERLARWILMCDDRVSGAELPLTHEYISVMLASSPSGTAAVGGVRP
jgi:CRP-like cAMP-binding protein